MPCHCFELAPGRVFHRDLSHFEVAQDFLAQFHWDRRFVQPGHADRGRCPGLTGTRDGRLRLHAHRALREFCSHEGAELVSLGVAGVAFLPRIGGLKAQGHIGHLGERLLVVPEDL